MEFNHTCRKCKHLELTRRKVNKEWECPKKKTFKSYEETIFNNLCTEFESKSVDKVL